MADTQASNPFSNAISSVGNVISKYEPFSKEKRKLEETFYAAGGGLYLIKSALRAAQLHTTEAVPQAALASLESCETTATKLEAVFNELSKVSTGARQECYVAYIKKKGRSNLVEILVIKMMDCVCEAVKNYATGEDFKEQLTELQAAINKLRGSKPSVPIEPQGGYQFVNNDGEQYSVTDNASQFISSTFLGTVTFN